MMTPEHAFRLGQHDGHQAAFDNLAPGVYVKCSNCLRFGQCETIHLQGRDVLCEECG